MLEASVLIALAGVGALWRMAYEQGSMKRGMDSIIQEIKMLRAEVHDDIRGLSKNLDDHEARLRAIENRKRY